MTSYYAVERSSNSLSHYGVKGMKWGVRKALKKTGERKNRSLAKQYKKAAKKLAKLDSRADIEVQKQRAGKMNKIAKVSGKVGLAGVGLVAAGGGTNHLMYYLNGLHKKIAKHDLADLDRESSEALNYAQDRVKYANQAYKNRRITKADHERELDSILAEHNAAQDAIGEKVYKRKEEFNTGKNKRETAAEIGKYTLYAGAGLGIAGAGTAAIAKGKAIAAKRRTTEKGHAKAVSERDAWKKEMKSAFSGTKYANLPPYAKNLARK